MAGRRWQQQQQQRRLSVWLVLPVRSTAMQATWGRCRPRGRLERVYTRSTESGVRSSQWQQRTVAHWTCVVCPWWWISLPRCRPPSRSWGKRGGPSAPPPPLLRSCSPSSLKRARAGLALAVVGQRRRPAHVDTVRPQTQTQTQPAAKPALAARGSRLAAGWV